ncbi:hypothetical protein WAH66_21355, partial [Acinetobacter baumannii]
MKTLITLILSTAAISAFSQPKGIKCIYASTMQVKKKFLRHRKSDCKRHYHTKDETRPQGV